MGGQGGGRRRTPAVHRLDAAGHYRQMRDLDPLAPGVLDVGGATLFIGAGLKRSMSAGNYDREIAAIAAAVGHDRAGRLAVVPTVTVAEYPAFGWRIVDPDGVCLATNWDGRAPWTRAARIGADHA